MPPIYANGHISETGDPIHFMFGSRVGFSGTADGTALFTVRKIQDGGRRHVDGGRRHVGKNFKWPYLRNRWSNPLHVFYRVGFSGT